MPAFVWLDGEKDGAIVDDGFLRLFMMGVGPVRLSVMIEYECTLTATFGPLDLTCLRCLRLADCSRSHVDAAISCILFRRQPDETPSARFM